MTPTVEEGPFVTVADPAPAPGLWTLLQVIHTNSTGGQENIWSWCSSHVVGIYSAQFSCWDYIWLEQAQLGMRRHHITVTVVVQSVYSCTAAAADVTVFMFHVCGNVLLHMMFRKAVKHLTSMQSASIFKCPH